MRRSRGDRRLLLGAFAGILIAATAVATAPLYLRSLEKIGVADALVDMGPYNPNIQITTSWTPLDRTEFEIADNTVARLREQYIPGLVRAKERLIKSTNFFWAPTGLRMRTDPLASQLSFLHFSNLDGHVRYTEGQAPSARVDTGADGVLLIEASVPADRAKVLGLRAGDVVDAVPGASRHGRMQARITGLFEVIDWEEEYWLGLGELLLLPSPWLEGQELPVTFLVQEATALDGVARVTAGLPATYWWWLYTRIEILREMPAGDIIATTDTFEERLEKALNQPNVISGLGPTFRELQRKLLFARIPMFLLAALAIAAVGYYLLLVSGLLARKREPDNVMLRSRGLSLFQIVRMYGVEAVVLIGVPVAVAPLFAMVLVSQLGHLPVYNPVTGGGALPVEPTWKAWAWAAAAGAVAFIVLLLPVLGGARRGVAAQRVEEGRPDRAPFYQRYFLDVLLLALGGLVWWELRSRGTIAGTGAEGEQNFDLTLLFSPAMFLVAAALIFLRLFPLTARISAWVTARVGSAWVAVGFWRLGRSPYWYAWPVLLLVLASGLAVISGTLASTLERSNQEQIEYQVGGDFHIVPGTRARIDEIQVEALKKIDGVGTVSNVLRQHAVHGTTAVGGSFILLAVESLTYPEIASFREDFAQQPVKDLLARLPVEIRPDPIYLPEGTTEIGIWARTDPPVRNLFLWAVLRDGNGINQTVTLGPTARDWTYQSAEVSGGIPGPIEVVSLQTFEQAGPDGGHPTLLYLDDLQAVIGNAPGGPRVELVIDFEEPGLWTGLPTSEGVDTTYGLAGEPAGMGTAVIGSAPGRTVARVVLGRGTDNGVRGIYRTATAAPIPVLANPLFLQTNNAREGEPFVAGVGGAYAPLVIVGTVTYFPTLDPLRQPFLIADVDTLVGFLQLRGLTEIQPNELLVGLAPGADGEKVTREVRRVFPGSNLGDRAALMGDSVVDPLAVAGWRGIGIVAVVLAGVATVMGYLTYLGAHARRTRGDAAYMRSLGLSRGGYLRMVLVEHSLVGILGVGLGIASGLVVSGLAVSSIAHTSTGRELVPPFVLQTNWLPAGLLLGAVALAAAVAIAAILRAYSRTPTHELVRAGE